MAGFGHRVSKTLQVGLCEPRFFPNAALTHRESHALNDLKSDDNFIVACEWVYLC